MRTIFTKNENSSPRFRFISTALLMLSALLLPTVGNSGQVGGKAQDESARRGTRRQFICERRYINFAFGRTHRGIYVDSAGGVYSYAYQRPDQPWRPSPDDIYTEEELLEKYSHGKQLVATVKQREVWAKRRLILKASAGAYSERIRKGADQGTYTSVCYLYEASTNRYREIILKKTGDERYENLSEAAKTLSAWLDRLAAKQPER